MRVFLFGLMAAAAFVAPSLAHDGPHGGRKMVFPTAVSGGLILPVDLHTHSVFSDGNVWPTIRIEEAQRDGLAAMAVTEHIEYQPHAADIPHPDRNRSFRLASDAAKAHAPRIGTRTTRTRTDAASRPTIGAGGRYTRRTANTPA